MGDRLVLKGSLTKKDFQKLYRKCKDVRMRERYHAMYLSFDYDWKEISSILGIDYRTVMQWAKAYNESGISGLARGKPAGRPAGLSDKQKSILKGIASVSPRKTGMKFSSWTCKSIGLWVKTSFGVRLS